MGHITGDSSNLIKFNGPFRIITTDKNDFDMLFGENHNYVPQTIGSTLSTNCSTKIGETTQEKFE